MPDVHDRNTYARGCRCDVCRTANREHHRLWRLTRGMTPIAEIQARLPHGTPRGYRRGCRCARCRHANTLLQRRRTGSLSGERFDYAIAILEGAEVAALPPDLRPRFAGAHGPRDGPSDPNYVARVDRRAWINAYKLAKGCDRCGYAVHPAALHFHHRDPATKLFALGMGFVRAWEKVLAEIAKCDVICANCHAIETQALIDMHIRGVPRAERRRRLGKVPAPEH